MSKLGSLFQASGKKLSSDWDNLGAMLSSIVAHVRKTKDTVLDADDHGQDWEPPREPRVGFASEKTGKVWTIRVSVLQSYEGQFREFFRSKEGRAVLLDWLNAGGRR